MFINSTNINKTNSLILIYWIQWGNNDIWWLSPGPGLGQARTCGRVKPVNGIPTKHPFMITVLISTTCIIQHYSTILIATQFSDLSKTYWKVCIVQYIIRISNLLLDDREKTTVWPSNQWMIFGVFLYFRWRVPVHLYYIGEINIRLLSNLRENQKLSITILTTHFVMI